MVTLPEAHSAGVVVIYHNAIPYWTPDGPYPVTPVRYGTRQATPRGTRAHGARGPRWCKRFRAAPARRERCDPSRMKVKRLDLRYSLIGVVGTAPLEHGELHRSAKVVGAGLLRFLLLKALLSLD